MRTTGPIYNFAGGPAVMPKSVLMRAKDELLDWHNTGMSVLEMPFSSTHFISIMASAKQKIHWIIQQGGVLALAQRNQQRADKLYALLDADSFYSCHVEQQCRSVMNLCFQLPNTQLERAFLAAAEQQGLLNLQGHQQVGGIRASLYNAQTADAINALTDFMEDFRATHSSQR